MSAEVLAAIGAVLAAVGSAVSAWAGIRTMRRQCEERLEAFREGLREGRR
jgi:hypothetical protein